MTMGPTPRAFFVENRDRLRSEIYGEMLDAAKAATSSAQRYARFTIAAPRDAAALAVERTERLLDEAGYEKDEEVLAAARAAGVKVADKHFKKLKLSTMTGDDDKIAVWFDNVVGSTVDAVLKTYAKKLRR